MLLSLIINKETCSSLCVICLVIVETERYTTMTDKILEKYAQLYVTVPGEIFEPLYDEKIKKLEFVENTVSACENMFKLCLKMSDSFNTNITNMEKLKETYQWSKQISSWEEDDLMKNIIEKSVAQRLWNKRVQDDLIDMLNQLSTLTQEIIANHKTPS